MNSKLVQKLSKPQASMEHYELVVIFKPFLPDQVRGQSDTKIEELVKKHKGSIASKDVWGKRYLAYDIQGHNEGYYVLYQIDMPTDQVENINKYMRRDSNALRFLMMKRSKDAAARHPDK